MLSMVTLPQAHQRREVSTTPHAATTQIASTSQIQAAIPVEGDGASGAGWSFIPFTIPEGDELRLPVV
jgi:hypothetical protein